MAKTHWLVQEKSASTSEEAMMPGKRETSMLQVTMSDGWRTRDKHAYCRTPSINWGEDQALLRTRRGSIVERIKARVVG